LAWVVLVVLALTPLLKKVLLLLLLVRLRKVIHGSVGAVGGRVGQARGRRRFLHKVEVFTVLHSTTLQCRRNKLVLRLGVAQSLSI
jgi:hypothetical protein